MNAYIKSTRDYFESFRLKKVPYYLALSLLTVGASLILGFLSFSGMYAMIPFLPFAMTTFGLSVAYEGEIYLQNIKGALNKLFQKNYLQNHLAKAYLKEKLTDYIADSETPAFISDYLRQLQNLSALKNSKTKGKKAIKRITHWLKEQDDYFAQQLFFPKDVHKQSADEKELQAFLLRKDQAAWQEKLNKQRASYNIAKGLSILSALFMGLGSTYLIVEAFSAIPFFLSISFTFWPLIIVPMALVAGTAYGLLTYNAVTDLINNDTIVTWYKKLRADWSKGISIRAVLMTVMSTLLVGLAVALTICTAGTWWTVATNARPLFAWMGKMPGFIMGIINPIITGLSAIFFNIENTSGTLQLLDETLKSEKSIFQKMGDAITGGWQRLRRRENWLQIINPFRIAIKITLVPLRLILFLGHLLSIALTADRMPGISQRTSALIAMISEFFEDAHYFVDHEHSHDYSVKGLLKARAESGSGHHHHVDIPTRLLKLALSPLYVLAKLWELLAGKLVVMPVAPSVVDDTRHKHTASCNGHSHDEQDSDDDEDTHHDHPHSKQEASPTQKHHTHTRTSTCTSGHDHTSHDHHSDQTPTEDSTTQAKFSHFPKGQAGYSPQFFVDTRAPMALAEVITTPAAATAA